MNTYAFLAIGLVVGLAIGLGIGYTYMMGPVQTLEGRVSTLQSQTASLQAQNNDLTSQYQVLSSNLTDLQNLHDALEGNYSALSAEHTTLQTEYTGLQADYADIQDILNLNKEATLETDRAIAFGSLTPASLLNYTLPYPGFLELNISASQVGGIFECFVFNEDLSDSQDFEDFFNMTGDTFELSGSIYLYMGTGTLNKTLMLPVLPGNNTVVLVYVGDTVESTTITFDIKYVY
jgi:chaperonin cofactor prefoldin